MSEYDYSGLYNNGGPQNNNGQPAGTQPEQPQAEQSGYPNVGSSGMNTANTAQTDYSNYSSQQNSSYNPQGPVAGNGSRRFYSLLPCAQSTQMIFPRSD